MKRKDRGCPHDTCDPERLGRVSGTHRLKFLSGFQFSPAARGCAALSKWFSLCPWKGNLCSAPGVDVEVMMHHRRHQASDTQAQLPLMLRSLGHTVEPYQLPLVPSQSLDVLFLWIL